MTEGKFIIHHLRIIGRPDLDPQPKVFPQVLFEIPHLDLGGKLEFRAVFDGFAGDRTDGRLVVRKMLALVDPQGAAEGISEGLAEATDFHFASQFENRTGGGLT